MDQSPEISEPQGSAAVLDALAAGGVPWREVPFTREGWDGEFATPLVKTVTGSEILVSPEAISMPDYGLSLLGLIRPTLESPSYISAQGRKVDFHRAVLGADRKVLGYACVSVMEKSIAVSVLPLPAHFAEIVDAAALGSDLVSDADTDGTATFSCLSLMLVKASNLSLMLVSEFGLAGALLGWGGEFFKAEYGPIPDGARWITVHPNGEGTKGTPVLVEPAKDKSGVFHVIGGAGGKLNLLKLRGVKSEGQYRQESAERAALKRQAKKAAARRDKELGIDTQKNAARQQINAQRKTAQTDFVHTVAQAMGWSPEELSLDTTNLSPEAAKKATAMHASALLTRAKEAVNTQRIRLVDDLDARLAAGLGEVPFDAGDDALSVQDLDPVQIPDGSGVTQDFSARAQAAGLDQATLDAEVTRARETPDTKLNTPNAAAKLLRGEIAKQVREELKTVQPLSLQTKIAEAHQAVTLIRAQKKLAAIEKAAKEANREVDGSTVEPKAYVLAVTEPTDEAVVQSVEDDLRTVKAHAFLAGVDAIAKDESVQSHVTAGAYNAVNAVAQVVAGGPVIDRSVVDVLGIAGAAQVLAGRIRADLGDRVDEIASGLEQYHVALAPVLQEEALARAKELQDAASEIEAGEAAHAGDLEIASEMNRKRREDLMSARRVMGQALGEMEATAALIAVLRGGKRDFVQVSLGHTLLDSAVKQMYALGLTGDDYSIDRVAGNTFATIKKSGMDKLAAPVDQENVSRVERNLSIMRGDQDEANWLPKGFAHRPDLGLQLPAGVSPRLASAFDFQASDLAQALRDYIGGRTADGERAADILADVSSQNFFQRVGRSSEYRAALDSVVPTITPAGPVRVEQLAELFDSYADQFVEKKWGGTRSTLNKQFFEADAIAQDALHRALSEEPTGVVAFKPIGDLTHADRTALRKWFSAHVAHDSPEHADLRQKVAELTAAEPTKMTTDMFGESTQNPAWLAWHGDLEQSQNASNAAGLDWPKFVTMMGGAERAIETVQDLVRSKISEAFAQTYNVLRPDAALKIGKTVVRNNISLLNAIDPAQREKRLSLERALIDKLRARIGGKYASGSVVERMEAAKARDVAFGQSQMGFFAAKETNVTPGDHPPGESQNSALLDDERYTLGHVAETMISKMMGPVGKNFEPGHSVRLFQPSMSGPEGAKRQRMIKMICQNKRVICAAGTGSGKTGIGLGAFAQLASEGKVKKGLFMVPSIVQGQFGAEALRFMEPGKFKWHAHPGASYQERLAAYKDPETNFSVVTHQSFRDDVLKMAAGQTSQTPQEVASKLASMTKPERAAFIKAVLDKEGIAFDFAMADEGHLLLNRAGKENSRMANVIEGVTDNAEYLIQSSADPVKNDASEVFSLLQKMDGKRYDNRGAFMRRYGGDTKAARDGLERELARYLYAMELNPNISVERTVRSVAQTPAQQEALDAVEQQAASLRLAKMTGEVNIDVARAFAPHMFEGVPAAEQEAVAREVSDSVGILKRSAVRRVLDNHPAAGKLNDLADIALARKGKQGVVFAHSLAAVENIKARLVADGHRVITITGKDSAQEKADKIQQFNPDKGSASADIVVCSDAGATGANLQSGRWLYQYDTPDTAMLHAQRQGRINRIGQKNNLELMDAVSDHAVERRARDRLARKYGLRELLTTPLEGIDDTGLAFYLRQKGIGGAQRSV